MTREVDRTGFGMQIHQKGNDGRRKVSADVIDQIALVVSIPILNDAIRVGIVLERLVTLLLIRDALEMLRLGALHIVPKILQTLQLVLIEPLHNGFQVLHAHFDPDWSVDERLALRKRDIGT